ncbi:hypothetical protein SAMN04488100_11833 [Alkalibacterium putridalgicola]|uniref:DUF7000 domain-containing protein n=1 Tax=Alkalibacterium putridalgicola TaxID=426703 RepID=A0A1H7UK07_9LACT|nr:hypothetical protein [Alkalibacterium putridalgicola]GEK88254.1 hypothetical protein APU01nite_02930 [Alkalibacterium putridalgicola]SEL97372.1 hypothetical protein SAMN04488100_11833 [Alkalibacterium putridalgicola]
MASLNESMIAYGELIKETDLQQAYKGLMQFMKDLRTHLKEKHLEYDVSANLYPGYLDLTFFSFTTELSKKKDLKYMVVFIHEKTEFQIWLSGRNRKVMSAYHEKFKSYKMGDYTLTSDETGMSAIIESSLVEDPDFDQLTELTRQIDTGIDIFIKDIEKKYVSSSQY